MTDTRHCSELYDEFLNRYPLDSLHEMTLDEYSNTDRTSFCFRLESKTQELGSIWGGSSYKFGIYRYAKTPKGTGGWLRSDDMYAWYGKYGDSREEAYARVNSLVTEVATLASKGDFESIDYIDLGPAVKWKIAFLYSNRSLVGIFNPDMLRAAARSKGIDVTDVRLSALHRELMQLKPKDMDVFEYSEHLWTEAKKEIENTRNVWLYSPGENAYNWDNDRERNIMSIGWCDIGNLLQYKSKNDIKKALQSAYDSDKEYGSNSKCCYDFAHNIKAGDIVIARKGVTGILGVGTVQSDYMFAPELEEFPNVREVSWLHTGCWWSPEQMPRNTLVRKDFNFYNYAMQLIYAENMNHPLVKLLRTKKQIVLQGAPGTGKTYKTSELAVRLCSPQFAQWDDRKALMDEYRRLSDEGRVGFVTFHQSLDYEEFIEGLRPEPVQPSGITYTPQPGIFTRMAYNAFMAAVKKQDSTVNDLMDFDEAVQQMIDDISSGRLTQLSTKTGQTLNGLSVSPQKNIRFKAGGERHYTASISRLKALYQHYNSTESLDQMANIHDGIRDVIGGCNASGYWAVLHEIVGRMEAFNKENTDETITAIDAESPEMPQMASLMDELMNRPELLDAENADAYVLVIDEINRGNVSKVFGELITLLESDKRIGEENALSVILPYSRRRFGVPSNLYIIATMNTADRSIGYLDYAIRRRFGFETLVSDRSVLESYPYESEQLRQSTLDLYDKVSEIMRKNVNPSFDAADLMPGHSYFLAKDRDSLKIKLQFEIKPLLQEYCNDGLLVSGKDKSEITDTISGLAL